MVHGRGANHARRQGIPGGGLCAWLDDAALTPGQKKRLAVFGSVEGPVCARIEEICGKGGVDVVDVAVLVVAPEARRLFFDDDLEPGVSVVIGHRSRVYASSRRRSRRRRTRPATPTPISSRPRRPAASG